MQGEKPRKYSYEIRIGFFNISKDLIDYRLKIRNA